MWVWAKFHHYRYDRKERANDEEWAKEHSLEIWMSSIIFISQGMGGDRDVCVCVCSFGCLLDQPGNGDILARVF